MTYETFITEITKRMTPENSGSKTPEAIACWYVAWDEAEQMRELSTRDLAEMIQKGLKPIDSEYVRDWCEQSNDPETDPKEQEESDGFILAALDAFFTDRRDHHSAFGLNFW